MRVEWVIGNGKGFHWGGPGCAKQVYQQNIKSGLPPVK